MFLNSLWNNVIVVLIHGLYSENFLGGPPKDWKFVFYFFYIFIHTNQCIYFLFYYIYNNILLEMACCSEKSSSEAVIRLYNKRQ
jgi:hypothetical protein